MKVQEFIETKLAPKLQGDGGWVEFVSQSGSDVELIFRGECSKCFILDRCVSWMEEQICTELDQKVKIRAVRKKPFFWDT